MPTKKSISATNTFREHLRQALPEDQFKALSPNRWVNAERIVAGFESAAYDLHFYLDEDGDLTIVTDHEETNVDLWKPSPLHMLESVAANLEERIESAQEQIDDWRALIAQLRTAANSLPTFTPGKEYDGPTNDPDYGPALR